MPKCKGPCGRKLKPFDFEFRRDTGNYRAACKLCEAQRKRKADRKRPSHKRVLSAARPGMPKKVIFGDIHFPFANRELIRRALEVVKQEEPEEFVQIGDLYDLFSFSRFPKARRVDPGWELDQARESAEWMFEELGKIVERRFLVKGNHDVRVEKYIAERAPDAMALVRKPLEALYTFPGVTTIMDPREDLTLNGIVFQHGDDVGNAPGRHIRSNIASTVYGHTHKAYIHYEQTRQGLMWELNVGYLADPEAEALRYPPKRYTPWTHGVGVIDSDGMPRFRPLLKPGRGYGGRAA